MLPSRATAAPAPRRTSVDEVYDAVKRRILDNEYPPGFQILEQALALQLGVSRTPVREALLRLQAERLVEIVPRHGMRVLPVSTADMQEIYDVLTSLEPMAVLLVARRKPAREALKPLEDAVHDMGRALRAGDLDSWADADERFHWGLLELCGNRRLAAMVMTCWDQAHRARMFTLRLRPKPVQSTREHRAVLEAIRRGDAAKASEIYRAHRERGGRELIGVLQEYKLHRM
jgi:DNA-binding GntR family transcriptional regulator